MSNFQNKIRNYTQVLYWAFVFVLSAVLLYLILPGEPKFKYEYQKGLPWRHDNLVAPFDFAILKTASELEAEKAEVLKTVVPYFTHDTTVYAIKLAQLKADLNADSDTLSIRKKQAFELLENKLREIYADGILQRSANTYSELEGKTEIKKRVGPVVNTVAISKLYSEKSAYNAINETLDELSEGSSKIKSWLSAISPEHYLSANLEYDKQTTDKEIAELTAGISAGRGMVQAGQRIVLQGEIVDGERFQLLESLKASFEQERGKGMSRYWVALGKALFILTLLTLAFSFIFIYRRDVLNQLRRTTFLMLFMVGMVFLAIFINTFPNLHIYMTPLVIFPIIIRTFFDSRTAIFMAVIITLLIGFYAPNNYEFILLQISASIVAVLSLNRMHRRVHLVLATLWVLLSYSIVYVALNLIHEGSVFTFDFEMLKWFALSSVLLLLVYPLVFVFEKIFGFVSDVTLIELSDSNQPLLRKLAEEAPGTFQHSMQIANLAEEVILKIGGNPFLVRAGALYHDIGKIAQPNFFIENQVVGLNPHDEMSYQKSAEIIIDHVKNGVKLAHKHKLPAPIVEFIATHHGTTKANYFYLKQAQENPDEKINEESFGYPGPLPRSKEAAVVMLVDGIEAASRSLKEKNYTNLQKLINEMIDQKIKLNQLDQSALTFNDINIIKETLLNKLINIYHIRIEYPKEQNQQNEQEK